MGEVLKITVDDKGMVQIWENGIETKSVKKIGFTAGVDEFPQLAIEKFYIESED